MTALPDAATLYRVIDATWPPASTTRVGPWCVREGRGGGNRVSATTARDQIADDDIVAAEAAMLALDQPRLFMIRENDSVLDDILARRGYAIRDAVTLYAAPVAAMATDRPPPVTTFDVWPPLAAQAEVWEKGGIGAARLAVMDRADCPKTTVLGRADDRAAATVYAGISEGCAMIHALEVDPAFRRRGMAQYLTRAVAFWAQAQGADYLTLVTTQANVAANALYTSLGMAVVGHYHYRHKTE